MWLPVGRDRMLLQHQAGVTERVSEVTWTALWRHVRAHHSPVSVMLLTRDLHGRGRHSLLVHGQWTDECVRAPRRPKAFLHQVHATLDPPLYTVHTTRDDRRTRCTQCWRTEQLKCWGIRCSVLYFSPTSRTTTKAHMYDNFIALGNTSNGI